MVDGKKKKGGLVPSGTKTSKSTKKAVEASTATALFDKNDKTLQGRTAVSTPSAQITKLCNVPTSLNVSELTESLDRIDKLNENAHLKLGLRLMIMYGLRVSEMLGIRYHDVMRNGSVLVRGLKGSSDRVCYDSYMMKEWLYIASSGSCDLSLFNRFYVYRLLKKMGLYGRYGNNANNSVTHNSRHVKGLEMKNSGVAIEVIQHEMGHKSIKSTGYYVTDKREPS